MDQSRKPIRRLLETVSAVVRDAAHRGSRQKRKIGVFEEMEQRTMLAADLLSLGAVYIEQDLGSDALGDTIEFSFSGGAEQTELRQIILSTDRIIPGLSSGDVVFDVAPGGLGADGSSAFAVLQKPANATVSSHVLDGSTQMTVDLSGFYAGDKLVVSLDVDEVEFFSPYESDPESINSGLDPITSGVEFQGVSLSASFTAPGFYDQSISAQFWNKYDAELSSSGLQLTPDYASGLRDRTAGAFATGQQSPLPVVIGGSVVLDRDANGRQDVTDGRLSNVMLELFRSSIDEYVDTGLRAVTDAHGNFEFPASDLLTPGVYQLRQVQPHGYVSVAAAIGSVDGSTSGLAVSSNVISEIDLTAPSASGRDFLFFETQSVSVSGRVLTEDHSSGVPELIGISGAEVDVLRNGEVVASTTTNSIGDYSVDGVLPGEFEIIQRTPSGLFDGPEIVGTVNGKPSGFIIDNDHFSGLQLSAGQSGRDFNFIELMPASLSGLVYQDGDAIIVDQDVFLDDVVCRDGQFTDDDTAIAGVTLMLWNEAGQLVTATESGHDGSFTFVNLKPGDYSITELQPDGWLDGRERVGTAGGTIDHIQFKIAMTESEVRGIVDSDRIDGISLNSNVDATGYHFSELLVIDQETKEPIRWVGPPEFDNNLPTTVYEATVPVVERLEFSPPLAQSTLQNHQRDTRPVAIPQNGSGNQIAAYTWHLSIVDGGFPRGVANVGNIMPIAVNTNTVWDEYDLTVGEWTIGDAKGAIDLGIEAGIPVTGDFNGDGISEVAVYRNGHWFVDLNGNGRWDEEDLWAELGAEGDLPVVGDWDGDGKDDIGVYGLQWQSDLLANAEEPGLPDPQNLYRGVLKNVPPRVGYSSGTRALQQSRGGEVREDVVDHVLRYGHGTDAPVVGDWNGDGISTVGVFRNGVWKLDTDGDGRISEADELVEFGAPGDVPVTGDFDGDGIDDIGVYRQGTWILDSDGDRHETAVDEVFHQGGANDIPVTGDFDGDGIDEIATYRVKKSA